MTTSTTTASTSTSRLANIVSRERKHRIYDIAFAIMIASFLILCVLSLGEAGAQPLTHAHVGATTLDLGAVPGQVAHAAASCLSAVC
ncbi:MAG: hypothetical protein H6709_16380 [Kofleriaceae bacterium]|nr:hypothetical protein [Myxococcales bacterium]MCB9563368.1 hypothetical protein [Kofleriaceae bacterium]MCB9573658.1 hypothetical protein [Kofleriaceae bacterium]